MKKLISTFSILVSILVPFFLLMSSVKLIMHPYFLDYEYNLPNFPPDPYGFSTQDRLRWGKISLDYLLNQEGIEYLADLKFSDGSVLYNERELSHMLDVKNLVQAGLKVWYAIIAFFLLVGVAAWKLNILQEFWKAVSRGGWLTLLLILLILAAVMIDFDALFAQFHGLFFQADTWLFYASDTLIRLFPEKLWSDGFTFAGIFTLVGGLLCGILGARFAHIK